MRGAVVLLAVAVGRAAAQTGLPLAELPGSTRAAALGGAGVALMGDPAAVFTNPAGIARIRRVGLEASFEPYLAGTTYTALAAAWRTGRFNWGLGTAALDYGSEPVVVPDPSTGGRRGTATGASFHPVDLLGAASLVYRRGLIAAGATAKYARQDIGSYTADGWAGDLGVALDAFDILALGVAVQNVGGDLGGGAMLGERWRVGLTTNWVNPQETLRLLATLEMQWIAGGDERFVAGLEGGVGVRGVGLLGRAGYATRSPTGAASRWTFGGGLEIAGVHLDYAYQAFDVLGGAVHRVGLRWMP